MIAAQVTNELITRILAENVSNRQARAEGAEILCGGGPHPDFDRGWFVQPTVARVRSNALRVCQEEVFGPFVTIQVFDEPEEAITIANDSDYGLVAYAWTPDLALTLELQRRIRAGSVVIATGSRPLVPQMATLWPSSVNFWMRWLPVSAT